MIEIFTREAIFGSSFQSADSEVENIFKDIKESNIKLDKKVSFFIQFVLRELFNNAVEHGNKFDNEKKVRYSISLSKRLFEIEVIDSGEGFDVEEIINRQYQESNVRFGNRGLSAIKDLGFLLKVDKNIIKAIWNIEESDILESEVKNLDINIDGKKAYLKLNINLIAVNVKSLVENVKIALEKAHECEEIVFDLTDLESIDSMGITFMIGVFKTITGKGQKMKLKGVSEAMMSLFKIMKLDEVFEFEG